MSAAPPKPPAAAATGPPQRLPSAGSVRKMDEALSHIFFEAVAKGRKLPPFSVSVRPHRLHNATVKVDTPVLAAPAAAGAVGRRPLPPLHSAQPSRKVGDAGRRHEDICGLCADDQKRMVDRKAERVVRLEQEARAVVANERYDAFRAIVQAWLDDRPQRVVAASQKSAGHSPSSQARVKSSGGSSDAAEGQDDRKLKGAIGELTVEEKGLRRAIMNEYEVGFDERAAFHKLTVRQAAQIADATERSNTRRNAEQRDAKERDANERQQKRTTSQAKEQDALFLAESKARLRVTTTEHSVVAAMLEVFVSLRTGIRANEARVEAMLSKHNQRLEYIEGEKQRVVIDEATARDKQSIAERKAFDVTFCMEPDLRRRATAAAAARLKREALHRDELVKQEHHARQAVLAQELQGHRELRDDGISDHEKALHREKRSAIRNRRRSMREKCEGDAAAALLLEDDAAWYKVRLDFERKSEPTEIRDDERRARHDLAVTYRGEQASVAGGIRRRTALLRIEERQRTDIEAAFPKDLEALLQGVQQHAASTTLSSCSDNALGDPAGSPPHAPPALPCFAELRMSIEVWECVARGSVEDTWARWYDDTACPLARRRDLLTEAFVGNPPSPVNALVSDVNSSHAWSSTRPTVASYVIGGRPLHLLAGLELKNQVMVTGGGGTAPAAPAPHDAASSLSTSGQGGKRGIKFHIFGKGLVTVTIVNADAASGDAVSLSSLVLQSAITHRPNPASIQLSVSTSQLKELCDNIIFTTEADAESDPNALCPRVVQVRMHAATARATITYHVYLRPPLLPSPKAVSGVIAGPYPYLKHLAPLPSPLIDSPSHCATIKGFRIHVSLRSPHHAGHFLEFTLPPGVTISPKMGVLRDGKSIGRQLRWSSTTFDLDLDTHPFAAAAAPVIFEALLFHRGETIDTTDLSPPECTVTQIFTDNTEASLTVDVPIASWRQPTLLLCRPDVRIRQPCPASLPPHLAEFVPLIGVPALPKASLRGAPRVLYGGHVSLVCPSPLFRFDIANDTALTPVRDRPIPPEPFPAVVLTPLESAEGGSTPQRLEVCLPAGFHIGGDALPAEVMCTVGVVTAATAPQGSPFGSRLDIALDSPEGVPIEVLNVVLQWIRVAPNGTSMAPSPRSRQALPAAKRSKSNVSQLKASSSLNAVPTDTITLTLDTANTGHGPPIVVRMPLTTLPCLLDSANGSYSLSFLENAPPKTLPTMLDIKPDTVMSAAFRLDVAIMNNTEREDTICVKDATRLRTKGQLLPPAVKQAIGSGSSTSSLDHWMQFVVGGGKNAPPSFVWSEQTMHPIGRVPQCYLKFQHPSSSGWCDPLLTAVDISCASFSQLQPGVRSYFPRDATAPGPDAASVNVLLRSIAYQNTSETPGRDPKPLLVCLDDGVNGPSSVLFDITVEEVDDPTELVLKHDAVTYAQHSITAAEMGCSPLEECELVDPDSDNFHGGFVEIEHATANGDVGDQLLMVTPRQQLRRLL